MGGGSFCSKDDDAFWVPFFSLFPYLLGFFVMRFIWLTEGRMSRERKSHMTQRRRNTKAKRDGRVELDSNHHHPSPVSLCSLLSSRSMLPVHSSAAGYAGAGVTEDLDREERRGRKGEAS